MDNKPVKYYVITDTHFCHDKMVGWGHRPLNFNQIIINQWRVTVQPQDVVFHLGDVAWGNQKQLIPIMSALSGTKILIRGNHDRGHSNNWFIKAGFAAVLEKAQVSRTILSHFPAILNQDELDRDIINVHGHFHNIPTKKWEPELIDRITPNHYLLSLEEVGYKPISMELIRKRKFIKNTKKLLESER